MCVFQVTLTELCALNPELKDHIDNVTSKAANLPRPVHEKVNVVTHIKQHDVTVR